MTPIEIIELPGCPKGPQHLWVYLEDGESKPYAHQVCANCGRGVIIYFQQEVEMVSKPLIEQQVDTVVYKPDTDYVVAIVKLENQTWQIPIPAKEIRNAMYQGGSP